MKGSEASVTDRIPQKNLQHQHLQVFCASEELRCGAELAVVYTGVDALQGHQGIMIALLGDVPVAKHQDLKLLSFTTAFAPLAFWEVFIVK